MDGIKRKRIPPEPRSEDIFLMTNDERSKYDIRMLPASLEEALDCLEKDPVIIEALGGVITQAHIKLKRAEWRKYVSHIVSGWEWEMYQNL